MRARLVEKEYFVLLFMWMLQEIRLLKMLEGVNIVIHVDMRKPLRCTLMRTQQIIRGPQPTANASTEERKKTDYRTFFFDTTK